VHLFPSTRVRAMWHSQAVSRGAIGTGALALALFAFPACAHAYDRMVGLSLELGYAVTPSGTLPPHGAYAEGGV